MKRQLPYLTLFLALIPLIFNRYHWISFYFEGDMQAYRSWFPNAFLPLYIIAKFFYPAVAGCWSAWLLTKATANRRIGVLTGVVQAVLVFYLEGSRDRGLRWISYDLAGLLLLTLVIIRGRDIYFMIRKVWHWLLARAPWLSDGYTYFIFCFYIILSLLLPEVQPFSRYPMYSQFPDHAQTFLIRDEHGKMVPLHRYFTPGAADLSHLYYHLMAQYPVSSSDQSVQASIDSTVGRALYQLLLANQTARPGIDTIYVNMQTIHISSGQFYTNEITLYKHCVE